MIFSWRDVSTFKYSRIVYYWYSAATGINVVEITVSVFNVIKINIPTRSVAQTGDEIHEFLVDGIHMITTEIQVTSAVKLQLFGRKTVQFNFLSDDALGRGFRSNVCKVISPAIFVQTSHIQVLSAKRLRKKHK